MIRVLLADDADLVRHGFALILESAPTPRSPDTSSSASPP